MIVAPPLRCVRCGERWSDLPEFAPLATPGARVADGAPGADGKARSLACGACGAPIEIDEVAIDVIPGAPAGRSPGARAMQSQWLAGVYTWAWRPLTFALSTGFGAPAVAQEGRLVLDALGSTEGPWLDVSCGPGALTALLDARARREGRSGAVVGLDRSRAMLERARRAAPGAVLVRGDATDLPFEDGVFAGVVNVAALDLYDDPARAVAEMARVLRPGGRWVCASLVRARPAPASRSIGALTGTRTPTVDELAAWAAGAGLRRFGVRRFRRYAIAWADLAG